MEMQAMMIKQTRIITNNNPMMRVVGFGAIGVEV